MNRREFLRGLSSLLFSIPFLNVETAIEKSKDDQKSRKVYGWFNTQDFPVLWFLDTEHNLWVMHAKERGVYKSTDWGGSWVLYTNVCLIEPPIKEQAWIRYCMTGIWDSEQVAICETADECEDEARHIIQRADLRYCPACDFHTKDLPEGSKVIAACIWPPKLVPALLKLLREQY